MPYELCPSGSTNTKNTNIYHWRFGSVKQAKLNCWLPSSKHAFRFEQQLFSLGQVLKILCATKDGVSSVVKLLLGVV